MNLRSKLLLAQAPLALSTLIVGALANFTLSSLSDRTAAILKDNQRSILAMQRLEGAVHAVQLQLLDGDVAPAVVEETLVRAERDLRLQESNITEPGEADATRELRAGFDTLLTSVRSIPPESWSAQYGVRMRPAFAQLGNAIARIVDVNQDALARKSTEAQRAAAAMHNALLWSFWALLLVGMLSSAYWTQRMLRPLRALSTAARSLANRDFQARALIVGSDEIAQLAREFNAMAEHLNVYQRSTLGELLQAQGTAQAAIDSLPDPVITFDAQGRIITVNTAAEDVLRVRMTDNNPLATMEPAVREAVERIREHVLTGKGPYLPRGFEESVPLTSPEGDRSLLPRASPVHDGRGNIMGATLILQDVTRLRRFDELKNNLVATVAHEFRTPLTSLHMAIHLCLEEMVGPINDKQRDLLHAARSDCQRLQNMVTDLLDLSRIEGGALVLARKAADSNALMRAMTAPFEPDASARNVRLVVEEALDLPEVSVDSERIALVFTNLIGNALRHTPDGGSITLRAKPDGKNVRFEVSDTGSGIDAAYVGRIFEKFFRVPGAPSGSAGIGLFIAREVVQAHGGVIGVESRPGEGSTFHFTVPAA